MTSKIRPLFQIFIIAMLCLGLYFALHFYRFIHQTPLNVADSGVVIMVPPGQPVHKMAENLEKAGVMPHPQWFLWWMQITGTRSQVKAGEYFVKPGTTPQGLIDLLVAGKVVQHALTIVEGWTFERLMQAVNEAPKLTHTLQGLSPKEIMVKLGYQGAHPEGQFFPDTYYFPVNTTDVAFLQRAYRVMQEKLNSAWENRDKTLSLTRPYEVLILASIIEKESAVPEEYAEIAGVYIRRLARNMPLQADPTVIYGMGRLWTGQLTLAHLRQPSTYNTYLNVGLPPTPIAMPSLKALIAATRPNHGETLFFVATGTDKRHIFSKTEDEHQKAVLRYRTVKAQIEKERSLAVQETAVIAEEEEMVAKKKEKQKNEAVKKTSKAGKTSKDKDKSNDASIDKKSSKKKTAEKNKSKSKDKTKKKKSKKPTKEDATDAVKKKGKKPSAAKKNNKKEKAAETKASKSKKLSSKSQLERQRVQLC